MPSRVSLRISLVTGVVAVVVFGIWGVLSVRAERRELWTVADSETQLLTRSLQVSARHALRDRQFADIEEHLRVLEHVEPDVDVFVYAADGKEYTAAPPHTKVEESVRRTAVAEALRQPPGSIVPPKSDTAGYFLAAAPLREAGGQTLGALVVARPLDRIEEDLRTTRNNVIVVVLTMILLSTLTSFVLGEIYVGRRLARLADALRKVGHGDYNVRVEPGALDEVGVVVQEFDRMAGQLSEAKSELEAHLDEKRRAERALQRADRLVAVGRLSAALAHEIGSPLQVIAGRARSLAAHPENPEQIRRNARILANQADRIARVVQNLLGFARQHPARRQSIEVRTVVAEVLDLLEIEARRRGVRVRFAPEGGESRIVASPDQIQQLTFNLVVNALAAVPEGGTIDVKITPAKNERGRDGAEIVVEDSGSGMSPEILARLFEPFFTTRLQEGGTGLGLAVVHTIVQEHGGTIHVESREALGTRFCVWLPESAEEAEMVQGSG